MRKVKMEFTVEDHPELGDISYRVGAVALQAVRSSYSFLLRGSTFDTEEVSPGDNVTLEIEELDGSTGPSPTADSPEV